MMDFSRHELCLSWCDKVIAPGEAVWSNSGGLRLRIAAPARSAFWIFDCAFRTGGHASS